MLSELAPRRRAADGAPPAASPRDHQPVVLLLRRLDGTGGVTRSVSNLANGLAAAGHDVTVLALLRVGEPRYALDARIHVEYVRDPRTPVESRRERTLDSRPSELGEATKGMSALTDQLLRRRLRSLPPSTLITHRPVLHEAAARWAPAHTLRLAVEHTEFERRSEEAVRRLRDLAPRLDRIVLLTEHNRRAWADVLGSEDRLAAIPNGVPIRSAAPRTSWAEPHVVAAGTLIRRKGFHRLVKAFAPLSVRHPDWRLQIFGQGPESEALQSLIDAHGAHEAISLAGFTSDLEGAMRAASVYALPSRGEGLPMVVLEAMGLGLPVVAFDVPGPDQLILHGRTGLLAPPGDRRAFGEALGMLMNDEDLRAEYGAAARQHAERYRIESVVEQWRALIRDIDR